MARYANPILDADWPDPDVISVENAFYLVASSFNRAPGLPILRSADLVSWEIIGHALDAVPPTEHYRLPRHGSGVWAPSLRHHGGRFWIVYPDPDHGIFVLTATDPAGPWSSPRLLLAGRGLIDPCPLWDDDGRSYLVHGWAKSRSGLANRLTVVEVDPELRQPIGEARTVIDGDRLDGYRTLEGPKFYRRDGWYWIFAPAGGVTDGWQSVFRSRSVWGPYQDRIVLRQGKTAINGPHQGGWVTAADGSDWFVHFQDRGCFGRVTHLQPMRWGADGWPVLGEAGEPVAYGNIPGPQQSIPVRPSAGEPTRNDDFTGSLNWWWHWQANPGSDWARAGQGRLALTAQPNPTGDLRQAPHVLGQQLPGQPSVITTSIALTGAADVRAGIVVLGDEYQWLGLTRRAGRTVVTLARSAGPAREDVLAELPVDAPRLQLDDQVRLEVQLTVDASGRVRFGARGAGAWQSVGEPFAARAGRWIGAEIGLFAESGYNAAAGGEFGPWTVVRADTEETR